MILSGLLILVAVVGYALFDRWDRAQNRGYEFGYYGDFNRILHSLESMPDVSGVTATAMNLDLALEEFGLEVSLLDGRTANLFFQERDPIRALSGRELSASLKSLLLAQGVDGDSEQVDGPNP